MTLRSPLGVHLPSAAQAPEGGNGHASSCAFGAMQRQDEANGKLPSSPASSSKFANCPCDEHASACNGKVTLRRVYEATPDGFRQEYYFDTFTWKDGDGGGTWIRLLDQPVPIGADRNVANFMLWSSGYDASSHYEGDIAGLLHNGRQLVALGLRPRKYQDARLDQHRDELDALLKPLPVLERTEYVKALGELSLHMRSAQDLHGYFKALTWLNCESLVPFLSSAAKHLAPYASSPAHFKMLLERLLNGAEMMEAGAQDLLSPAERYFVLTSPFDIARNILVSNPNLQFEALRTAAHALPRQELPPFVAMCCHLEHLFTCEDLARGAAESITSLLKELPAGLLKEPGYIGTMLNLAPVIRSAQDLDGLRDALTLVPPAHRLHFLAGLSAAGAVAAKEGFFETGRALLRAVDYRPPAAKPKERMEHGMVCSSWQFLDSVRSLKELCQIGGFLQGVPEALRQDAIVGLGNARAFLLSEGVHETLEKLRGIVTALEGKPNAGDFLRAPLRIIAENSSSGRTFADRCIDAAAEGGWETGDLSGRPYEPELLLF